MAQAPRLSTIDQLIATANGGEFGGEFYERLNSLLSDMHLKRIEHQADMTASLKLTIDFSVDRYGDASFAIRPEFKAPEPPKVKGTGRAFLNPGGELTTHPQEELGLLRDVSRPERTTRDPIKRTEA